MSEMLRLMKAETSGADTPFWLRASSIEGVEPYSLWNPATKNVTTGAMVWGSFGYRYVRETVEEVLSALEQAGNADRNAFGTPPAKD